MLQCSLAALDGVPDRAQQHIITEWLRQELNGTRLHGLNRHGHIAVACDEYDWHVNPFDSDALLQIETVKARKRNVQYEAARNKHALGGQGIPVPRRMSQGANPRSESAIPAIRGPRCHH